MFWIRIRQNQFGVYGACCFMGQVPLQKVSEYRAVLYQSPSPPHVCPVVRGRESRWHGDSCHARTARAGVGAASVEEEQRAAPRCPTPWPWPPALSPVCSPRRCRTSHRAVVALGDLPEGQPHLGIRKHRWLAEGVCASVNIITQFEWPQKWARKPSLCYSVLNFLSPNLSLVFFLMSLFQLNIFVIIKIMFINNGKCGTI